MDISSHNYLNYKTVNRNPGRLPEEFQLSQQPETRGNFMFYGENSNLRLRSENK